MRLDKLLEVRGFGSRNQVKKLIKGRSVLIDGQPARAGCQNVDSGLQVIMVNGSQVRAFSHRYYLLHKPAGVVSACFDRQHQTVIDLIRKEDRVANLYPIGRLDRDTTGLVLLTDNGPLGFRMLHPKHHVNKTYLVTVNGYLAADAVPFFENGVTFLDGTRCKSAALRIIKADQMESQAEVTLSEGKYHQIKKMFLSYGLKVTQLKRIGFAEIALGDLAEGAYRQLTAKEKELIKTYLA